MTDKWALGTRVTKTKGSAWTGRIVGFYSTSLTPVGYCVESEYHTGSVQIYPQSALQICADQRIRVIQSSQSVIDAERERCAGIAKTGWVSADYNLVGIADADQAMALCEHIANDIRSKAND